MSVDKALGNFREQLTALQADLEARRELHTKRAAELEPRVVAILLRRVDALEQQFTKLEEWVVEVDAWIASTHKANGTLVETLECIQRMLDDLGEHARSEEPSAPFQKLAEAAADASAEYERGRAEDAAKSRWFKPIDDEDA